MEDRRKFWKEEMPKKSKEEIFGPPGVVEKEKVEKKVKEKSSKRTKTPW